MIIMGKKGNHRHIKSLAAPKYFGIERKRYVYVAKPTPGRHSLQKSIAANLLIKILGHAKTTYESDKIIKSGKMSIDKKVIKDPHYAIGFNDIVKFEGLESYIISTDKKGKIKPMEYKEEYPKVSKVVGKYKEKKGKIMLRLHNNRIIEGNNSIKINDSITTEDNRIKNVIKLQEGKNCFVITGVHVGKSGRIAFIKEGTRKAGISIGIETEKNEKFETIAKNIIVIG